MRKGDLQIPFAIICKGGLFLLLGLLAAGLLLSSVFSIKNLLLLGLTIWSFCRCYYFAFYVIQHYIDPDYEYRGLIDCLRYLLSRRSNTSRDPEE